jgi:hypothetical protein
MEAERRALDETAARRRASDEKRDAEAERREQVAVPPNRWLYSNAQTHRRDFG